MSILVNNNNYVTEYKQAEEFTVAQQDIYWVPHEIAMEKDLHDLHNVLTEAELHGVTTVLKLFTMYELEVGENYWGDFIMKKFPRPEIQAMASTFAAMELAVHAVFYRKINEVMNLDTNEFYSSYTDDPILKGRMDWISKQFESDDPLLTTAIGSITEGAILYSNFAFLKHFQSEGKSKLTNMTAGINFSVRDENLHSLAGAWLFRTLMEEKEQEAEKAGELLGWGTLFNKIRETCDQVFEHESRIIDMIFEKGDIKGITEHQMKQFIKGRLNLCLKQLGLEELYEVEYDPVAKWFYKNINSGQLQDFFHKQGNNYSRDWSEAEFTW